MPLLASIDDNKGYVVGLGGRLLISSSGLSTEQPSTDEKIVAVASLGRWVLTASSSKAVRCYEGIDRLHSTGLAPRRPSALAVAHSESGSEAAIGCGGELYALPVPGLDGAAQFRLGHTSSVITHISFPLQKSPQNVVVTCDRNEKIRVSAWPQAYVIHSFCLGHTSFATSASFFGGGSDRIVSCGGDGTLRLWNVMDGKECGKASLEGCVCTRLAVNPATDEIAVCTAEESVVRVYDKTFQLLSTLDIETPPIDLIFLGDSSLHVLVSDANILLRTFKPSDQEGVAGYFRVSEKDQRSPLVETARRLSLQPPSIALHHLSGGHEGNEEAEVDRDGAAPPAMLRKHTLDRRHDLAQLGTPTRKPRVA